MDRSSCSLVVFGVNGFRSILVFGAGNGVPQLPPHPRDPDDQADYPYNGEDF